jgi:hexosaminidase
MAVMDVWRRGLVAVAMLMAAVAARPLYGARPMTIPAVREWTDGAGAYHFGEGMRIVRNAADADALAATSGTLAEDLKALSGVDIGQRVGTAADVRAGDVFLALGATDTALGEEGYALAITDHITITAGTDGGVFNGTRTVLQLIRQNRSVAQGSARDWPAYRQRGLMVDNGRKYFTPGWLQNQVRELAYLKMNYFHLHLSDNEGFRIESATHPEFVSKEHVTKQDIKELQALAARYHVTIVPEFDMPGHMAAILAKHPELQLRGVNGKGDSSYIDLGNPASYALMKDIFDEYLPLFTGPYWHIGADEYAGNYSNYPQMLKYAQEHFGKEANAKDTYLGFINWCDGLVKGAGKTTRAWNDGIGGGKAVTVNADVVIEYWTGSRITPQQFVADGHLIFNSSWDPTYYVLGGSKPKVAWGYESWTPTIFQGNHVLAGAADAKNLGSKIHVWCDSPGAESEARVAAGIKDPLRMLAQQTWGSAKLVPTYAEFGAVMGAVGRNPQWPAVNHTGNLAFNMPATASSTETENFPAAAAVDGDEETRWSSQASDAQWLQVDLGAVKQIGRVKLKWEVAHAKAYQIQTSSDGRTWTTIYSTTKGAGGTEDLTGLNGSGRYVRMLGTARSNSWGYSLYEFEVYAP